MTFKNFLKGYKIVFSATAQKAIDKLDKKLAAKIQDKLLSLIGGDQNLDIKKLSGYQKATYRLRVADMRIIYAVWEDQVIIYIIEIGHRKEIYKD